MATHEQSELGPIFDDLLNDGAFDGLTTDGSFNSYEIAWEFARVAADHRVIFHVDEACQICRADSGDSIDAAWAEAEAALPEGWIIGEVSCVGRGYDGEFLDVVKWRAWAVSAAPKRGGLEAEEAQGDTPAAALRALAAELRVRD